MIYTQFYSLNSLNNVHFSNFPLSVNIVYWKDIKRVLIFLTSMYIMYMDLLPAELPAGV